MRLDITAPESITQERYLQLFTDLGFDPTETHELRCSPAGIHASVFARDENGAKIVDHSANRIALNTIFIPVLFTKAVSA